MSSVQKINDELFVYVNKEVGSGTFGIVFKGMYKNEVCAIKMLHHVATPLKINLPVGQGQENAIRAFGYESMVLESFQHPNVLQHFATTEHPSGNTMLVTELMDCNLSTYLSTPDHSSSLTSQCEISLSKDLASGLAYIHSRKIIHRDLCGVNVLLKRSQPFPVAKISDFGMSKLLDPLKFNTTISHRLGYLPPEALHEGDEDYDETLDVFSLGVIMMQIACRLENVKSVRERLSYLVEIKAGTHLLKLHIMACLQEKRPSAAVVCGQLEKHLLYRDAYRQDYDLVTIGGKRPILHSGNAVTPLATPHTTTQSVHETTATAAQLSQECSDEALLQLSTEIAGYNDYKHRLGVSYAEIKNIDLTIDGIPGKFLAALKKWKSKNILQFNPSNSTATYGRLVEIASEIEDGGAVRSIHKACVEHTFQPHKTIVTATAAQLSQECSDEALLQLSTEIAGYDRYKHRLGLSHAEIGAIDKSPSMVDNIPGRFLAALKMWKSKSILEMYPLNSTATYDQLVEIATKIEDGEAVRSIHKACVEHTIQPHETIVTATAAQLSQECSNRALLQLSTEIAGYETYKHRLGLSKTEVENIDHIFVGVSERFHAALKKWKSKNILQINPSNSTATYGRLVEIAAKIEDGEAVRSIHKACVEHANPLERKRLLGSGEEVETLSNRLKQGESLVEITNKSMKFSNFGIKISVLENSLPEGIDTCVLHISFELSTNFETPANSELVSSIYHMKCEPKVQFKKPLTLEIQHCASLNSGHQQRPVFARATDQSKKFEILEGGHFPIGERYGSIQLTRFCWFSVVIRKVFGLPTEKMYSALLFRKNLARHTIDVKCVVCQDLATHVKVIREELEEKDRFTKEMDLDEIQFENAVEMELPSENPELWTVDRVSSTLSRDRIERYSKELDSNRRPGVVPAIHCRFNLKAMFCSESVNFLLMKTDLDEESHHLTLRISLLPRTLGRSDSTIQREIAQRPSIVLTGGDILTICEKLRSASKNWFNLGLALGMKSFELENIQDRYQDNMHRLAMIVTKRLEVTDPEHPMTWPYICECLRRPTVERNDVAEEIEALGLCG